MTTAQLTLDSNLWSPPEPVDGLQQAVLAALRDGRTWTRLDLVRVTGEHDRSVRQAIEALRLAGWPVCSSSGRSGYRLSFTREDLLALERDLGTRAVSAFRMRRAIRKIRERRAGA